MQGSNSPELGKIPDSNIDLADIEPAGGEKTPIPDTDSTVMESTSEKGHSDDGINHQMQDLARRLTNASHAAPGALFPLQNEGPLDPNSPSFDARRWAKAFYEVRAGLSDGHSPRTAGVSFENLNVHGYGSDTDFQKSVGNIFLEVGTLAKKLLHSRKRKVDILHSLEGVLHSGEMMAVLGPPGSGCSTFLKTIAGETHGLYVDQGSSLNYQGIPAEKMCTEFRGEAIYTAEVDHHFPHLTVGDALYFAARARCPENIPEGITRREYAEHLRDVTMAMLGISHTINTRVGNDFVRGVSGGERKRVTIAEASLSYASLQCWDNSTRGLDSANALEFCRTLRTQADVMGCTSAVAIYQASQDAYDVFDKVLVLYQGRQIYFGKTTEAQAYFEGLGFDCPEQQTTADFLTSMTSADERVVRAGWEGKTPRSPDEFAQCWKQSTARARLLEEIADYNQRHPLGGQNYDKFLESRKKDQASMQRPQSPFTLSYWQQMKLCLWRSWVMLKGDPSIMFSMLFSNMFQALVVSSIFYNLGMTTTDLRKRSVLLFFIMLMNAFSSVLEIITLFSKRKIIEKHSRYALYHPSAEALASIVMDLPYKIVNSLFTNMTLYFMGNLNREAGPFFYFFLISFLAIMCMSMMFRFIGSVSKSILQAFAPSSIVLLAIPLYTGFVIPPSYMKGALGWIRWINPIYYALEAVMINEFQGRRFECSTLVPQGPGYTGPGEAPVQACNTLGAIAGQTWVSGSNFIKVAYRYDVSHKWRNFGILVAFVIAFAVIHLAATEYVASERSKGEVLVFRRNAANKVFEKGSKDVEGGRVEASATQSQLASGTQTPPAGGMEKQVSIFHWNNVCYDIEIKGEPRRILDNVDGWVKPGTLTALMGASGAGKTTLLDVLASRVTMGVVTGEMLVDGKIRDQSFQRKTGYVQQQDLHLHSSTVREALTFSALLRQPDRYTKEEKLQYVDTVIDLLDMQEYSDAIIGVPGEGLNVEQRKRCTIGVELAARPQLLLFLDEPTSGLDSQTSWSICNLMEKLTKNGQAILCTIHQPSAMLFQRFDRLLLLAKGKTIYFGEIGKNSKVLVDYFTRNGGPPCPPEDNPAEYMLHAIGAAPGSHTDVDWPAAWKESPEYVEVQEELRKLSGRAMPAAAEGANSDPSSYKEFAAPFAQQFAQVGKRVFQQYWRSPGYIYSKVILSVGAALFIGLSFLNAKNTQTGLNNQMFGVFMFLAIFGQIVHQIFPMFVDQRKLYEARERPSKAYSWQAFLIANILVEIVWNSLMAVMCFICWYFPIGLYRNARPTDAVDSRGITMMLQVWVFLMFASTYAHMLISGIETAEIAGAVMNLFLIMMFTFCGVLSGPNDMPRFWIFMYRVNPFTYVIEGFLGTSLANTFVTCDANELVRFDAPSGKSCGDYMSSYVSNFGGYLVNPNITAGSGEQCMYCSMSDTNTFLKNVNVSFDHRWRNFGLMWVYCIFNISVAFFLYWLVRVPKNRKSSN